MRKPVSAVINWFGPYTYEEAIAATRLDYGAGLYAAIGRCAYEKTDKFQYIGVSNNLHNRLQKPRGLYDLLSQKCILWLGEMASTLVPGKGIGGRNAALDLAESAHIFFMQPPLNTQKTMSAPTGEVTITNRWWKPDYVTPRKRKPWPEWPDIIEYWGPEYGARLVYLRYTRGSIVSYAPEDLI
jgi:hypothetical protein